MPSRPCLNLTGFCGQNPAVMKHVVPFALVVFGLSPAFAHAQTAAGIERHHLAHRDTVAAAIQGEPVFKVHTQESALHAVARSERVHPADMAVPAAQTPPQSLSIEELERLLLTAPATLSPEELRVLDVHYEREQVRQLRQIKWIVGVPIGIGAIGTGVAILKMAFR